MFPHSFLQEKIKIVHSFFLMWSHSHRSPKLKCMASLAPTNSFVHQTFINLFLDCQPKFIYLHPSSVITTNLLHDNNLGYDDCYRHLSFSSHQSSHARRNPPSFLIIIIHWIYVTSLPHLSLPAINKSWPTVQFFKQ